MDSLDGTAGRVAVGVDGASLAALAADAVEGGALVGAAEEVGETCLALCDDGGRLDGLEGLQACANCRRACKHQEQGAAARARGCPPDLHLRTCSGTNGGDGSGQRQQPDIKQAAVESGSGYGESYALQLQAIGIDMSAMRIMCLVGTSHQPQATYKYIYNTEDKEAAPFV
jgi:hypothetical protein